MISVKVGACISFLKSSNSYTPSSITKAHRQIFVSLPRVIHILANISIFKTEMNKRWLYVHKGGGPLQLLRIILATGGIVGTGGPSSSLVLGEPQEKAPDSAK